ncbi:CHASE2 domain-containing protein [Zavarzinia compransoris]|uniref:CHASE2 domain-containing protein n=1 Tax=Zavarzinia marina TaxID=2911065 RepID=UPI001F3EC48F|nr:adenylate/guanylate cyclase domain-containing protein [Zavarzinia marina]MCF4164130.1 CHASE2 domain-containing protein [Zavarzinia marina]
MPSPEGQGKDRGSGAVSLSRIGVSGALALLLTLFTVAGPFDFLGRAGIDFLIPARHALFGPLFPPEESDVVLVAIDEQTYHVPPFAQTPKVAWTPQLARILDAAVGAGARAVGFDVIFPVTLDRPDLLPGRDRPFLVSLRRAADAGKLVLGEARLSREVLRPHGGQRLAARGDANIRLLNLKFDDDDVVRTYIARYALEGGVGSVTSFGTELAARAGHAVPDEDFLINFNTGPGDVPTYSLADIAACIEADDTDYLKGAFAGKIVLIGEVLDIEDRFRAAKRYALTEGDNSRDPERCRIAAEPERFRPLGQRSSMPGVLIHAAAINTVTKDLWLRPLPIGLAAGLCLLWFLMLDVAFFRLRPAVGALAGAGAAGLLFAGSVLAFAAGHVVPILPMGIGALVLFAAIYAYRFVIEDGGRRRIHHAFRHYLAPALVDRLAEDPAALRLGGERRHVTVFFSDMVGFTSLSERLAAEPERFVDVVNQYLTVLTKAIERREGYIDKFIGDAVMAIWGAPLSQEEAETLAAEAALEAQATLAEFNRAVVVPGFGLKPLGTRIGIATGEAIVGNMGSRTRLNYTVTGDVVNLASRLESANNHYGTSIIVSGPTAERLGAGFVLRPLDRLVVKGKSRPVPIFELIGRRDGVDPARLAALAAFERGLDAYLARDFAMAADIFAPLAATDPVAALYEARARAFMATPPPEDWDGRHVLETK